MAFNQARYSGLHQNRPIHYQDPYEGPGQHFYFSADQPVSGQPETASIIYWPIAPPGYMHVIDKFKCSIQPGDAAKNQILAQFFSADFNEIIWQFTFNLVELAGNPFYNYPTLLADPQWIMTLSFQANSGNFSTEYFYFRYRYINRNIGGEL